MSVAVELSSYKSPERKLLPFFKKSRDKWKAKYLSLKADLKKGQNQVRAVEKSRAAWRSKAESANQRIRDLEQELTKLKRSAEALLPGN